MNYSPTRKKALICAAGLVLALALSFAPAGCEKKNRPNVILVIIDTLPASHVSSYGYERSTTPNLDRVATDGILFKNAVAPSPWTLPSFASILTGAYPSRHQAGRNLEHLSKPDRILSRMKKGMTTMADLFGDQEYQTIGFFNCPFTHPDFGLGQGFDRYSYYKGDNLNIRPANVMINEARTWIEENGDDPFFMVLHFFDPHLAYNPSIPVAAPYISGYRGDLKPPFNPELSDVRLGKTPLTDEDKKFVVGLYDGEVAATDAELGNFLRYLKDKGIYDQSLLIITADHGEEFWEHGGFEHGHTLHREVINVPLVIKYPGNILSGQKVDEYVSLLDIFPTVAELMEWQLPFPVDGRSLYPRKGMLKVAPRDVVSEFIHYGHPG